MSSRIARASSVAALMLAFVGGLAFGQETKSSADTSSTEQQVRAASQQMLQAAQKSDKETFATFLADDLAWVGRNGDVLDKERTLATLPAPVSSLDVQQVVPSGQTATLVAVVHMKDGTQRRLLQEWANRDGKWKVVAHESTPIGSEATPTMGTAGRSPGTSGAASPSELRTVAPALNSSGERAVWQAQTEIVDAYGKGDTTAYSKLTATPFTRVETNGQLYDRSAWLDHVAENRQHPLKSGAISDVHIKLDDSGKLAWVTLQLVPFKPDGSAGSPERQTRVFVLNDGQWQQLAAVSAPISER